MSTILLVEDDVSFATMLHRTLRMAGYDAVLARDGKEALLHYDPQTIALVVTDLMMPDMDGMELIMRLEERDPSVRIIAMSGGALGRTEAYLPMAERLGAVKTLAKPFSLESFLTAVRECLDQA